MICLEINGIFRTLRIYVLVKPAVTLAILTPHDPLLILPCCPAIPSLPPPTMLEVMMEIHESLLANDGLLEDEATNQGAWLTESAGALRDLHASILTSLLESEHASTHAARDDHRAATSEGHYREIPRIADSTDSDNPNRLHGDSPQTDGKLVGATKDSGVGVAPAEVGDDVMVVPNDFSGAQRTRLWELGRLLAGKRQWGASRQVGSFHVVGQTPIADNDKVMFAAG